MYIKWSVDEFAKLIKNLDRSHYDSEQQYQDVVMQSSFDLLQDFIIKSSVVSEFTNQCKPECRPGNHYCVEEDGCDCEECDTPCGAKGCQGQSQDDRRWIDLYLAGC